MIADVLRAAATVVRPLERLSPSAFAARWRRLKEGTSPQPGPWGNEVFPYLTPIMDAVEEAIRDGRNLVMMKSAQGGGSEAMINALLWLLSYYPGPALYLISKDDVAKEFGRDRFAYACETCDPIAKKHLGGRAGGELLQVKRFTDGKLVIAGGRSVLNLQTQPYRIVVIDEVDSLLDEIAGHGDPIKLAEARTGAYSEFGPTIIIAFAHPSTRERGAGRLYYELSDQRRPHVQCPHCSSWIFLKWPDVKVLPRSGQAPAAAERDPDGYHYVAPCCGAEITDPERALAVRRVEQRSVLPADEAGRRRWIGLHFSQFLMPGKPLRLLAQEWIDAKADPSIARVFWNKRMGDVYDASEGEDVDEDAWRLCITLPRFDGDPATYHRGEVPAEVAYLTAGTDANSRALHWTVWGWGLLDDVGTGERVLCGWLVDWGEIPRDPPQNALEASDLVVLDQILYDRRWARADGAILQVVSGAHDSGWQPVGVYEYCRRRPDRAAPIKGGSDDDRSESPLLRWGRPPVYVVAGREVRDPALRFAVINTFLAKRMLYGLVARRFDWTRGEGANPDRGRWRLHLPVDVDQAFLEQAASERIVAERRGKRWRKRGPNHFADCATYAFALATNVAPLQRGMTAAEITVATREKAKPPTPPTRQIRTRY